MEELHVTTVLNQLQRNGQIHESYRTATDPEGGIDYRNIHWPMEMKNDAIWTDFRTYHLTVPDGAGVTEPALK